MPILMFIYTPVISYILIYMENKVLIWCHIKSQAVHLSIRKTTTFLNIKLFFKSENNRLL